MAVFDENSHRGRLPDSIATYEEVYVEQLDSASSWTGAEGVPFDDLRSAVVGRGGALPERRGPGPDGVQGAAGRAQFDQLLGIVTVLLMMAVVIALFGIVNTLVLSIYERTRELGLLRAVGMGRTQVKRMIRYESVIISVFGAVLGILVGVVFGWAVLHRPWARRGRRSSCIPSVSWSSTSSSRPWSA